MVGLDLNIDSKSDVDFSAKTTDQIKEIFANSLNKGIYGICFNPYLENQNMGDQLSEEQIYRRMDVIAPYTKWVRSFSCTAGNEIIPKAAHKKEIKQW